ncbi:MAG: hypothetical protein FWF04_02785 [Clostridiales bacterium]|nr:hypothetical protein [Clostridiales bacterium]
MRADEFYATAEDGIIRIPEKYKNKKSFKVMVLEDFRLNREEANDKRKSDLLLPPTMDTKGWKFNREVANER